MCEEKQRRIDLARQEMARMAEARKAGLGSLKLGALAGSGGALSSLGIGLGLGGGGSNGHGHGGGHGEGGGGLAARLGSVVGGLMSWGHPTTPADTVRALEAEVRSLESLHK